MEWNSKVDKVLNDFVHERRGGKKWLVHMETVIQELLP